MKHSTVHNSLFLLIFAAAALLYFCSVSAIVQGAQQNGGEELRLQNPKSGAANPANDSAPSASSPFNSEPVKENRSTANLERRDFPRDRDRGRDSSARPAPLSTPRAIDPGQNSVGGFRESQEAYFNYQRRTKALSNAIVYLYAAAVFLRDASESDKAEILFSQAKDLARYAQREYRVQLPLELRQNLGLLTEEEYRVQKERENLQSELEQLRSRMENIEQRLNQLNSL